MPAATWATNSRIPLVTRRTVSAQAMTTSGRLTVWLRQMLIAATTTLSSRVRCDCALIW